LGWGLYLSVSVFHYHPETDFSDRVPPMKTPLSVFKLRLLFRSMRFTTSQTCAPHSVELWALFPIPPKGYQLPPCKNSPCNKRMAQRGYIHPIPIETPLKGT